MPGLMGATSQHGSGLGLVRTVPGSPRSQLSQVRHSHPVCRPAVTASAGPGWVFDQCLLDQLPLARTCCQAVTKTNGTAGEASWSVEKAEPTTQSYPQPSGGTCNFFKVCQETFSGSAAMPGLRSESEKMLVVQSCPTLYNSMDCSLPGSSVHGILQARILDWVAIPSSRESS